ncbi:MAG: 30S ribosomal protein S5 [Anaerolineales bacterium]
MRRMNRYNDDRPELDERIVDINRVAKVIKGGRRFAFRTIVVVGDNNGKVGVGVGKAKNVPDSIRKGSDRSRKNMKAVPMVGTTIPHEVMAVHGGARVFLKPAAPGTGVIAGGGVRAVLECVGIKDILTKSMGSQNVLNVVYATIKGLQSMKDPVQEAARRGKPIEDVMPFWSKTDNG